VVATVAVNAAAVVLLACMLSARLGRLQMERSLLRWGGLCVAGTGAAFAAHAGTPHPSR